jgi:hypothetical protein
MSSKADLGSSPFGKDALGCTNVITVGFEKIGCDSSANFIGVGLNSGLFKDLISVSLLSLVMA